MLCLMAYLPLQGGPLNRITFDHIAVGVLVGAATHKKLIKALVLTQIKHFGLPDVNMLTESIANQAVTCIA
jgi:hypothetical protein